MEIIRVIIRKTFYAFLNASYWRTGIGGEKELCLFVTTLSPSLPLANTNVLYFFSPFMAFLGTIRTAL